MWACPGVIEAHEKEAVMQLLRISPHLTHSTSSAQAKLALVYNFFRKVGASRCRLCSRSTSREILGNTLKRPESLANAVWTRLEAP